MKFISLQVIMLILIGAIANFYGCSSTHTETDHYTEDSTIHDQNTDHANATEDPNVTTGHVPPTNKNITMFYFVQSGDTLGKIAKKIYGDKSFWKQIAQENNLKNPHAIYAGDFIHYELTPQTKAFADTYENSPQGKIVVKRGDTLSGIAKAVFGKASDWRILWKENSLLKNPDKLKIGQEIFFKPRELATKNMVNTPQGPPHTTASADATQAPQEVSQNTQTTEAPATEAAAPEQHTQNDEGQTNLEAPAN